MKELIKKSFKNFKIELSKEEIDKYDLFFNILYEENKKTNLTRIVEKEDVVSKHFLDSVSSSKFIKENAEVIDIGAGAGFPSIPLKILRSDLKTTLIDSVNKKVNFLNLAIEKLELKDVKAIHARCEDLAHKSNFREGFDVCVSRAVADMQTLSEYCLPFVKVGGFL